MSRNTMSAEVKTLETGRYSTFLPSTLDRRSTGSWRITRVLAVTALIGGTIVVVASKIASRLRPILTDEKEDFMSTPMKAPETRRNGNGNNNGAQPPPKGPLLETLLEQEDRTVSTTRDNLLEQARTEPEKFSEAFEKRVGALSGFASVRRRGK